MRSTSRQMRSVSSRISLVSARSSEDTPASRSWAAPRIPDSGFLTSWASMAAMAETERTTPRCVNWRLRDSAMARSWRARTTLPASSASGAAWTLTVCSPMRGEEIVTPCSRTGALPVRAWSMRARSGLSPGRNSSRVRPRRCATLPWKSCSPALLACTMTLLASTVTTADVRASSIEAASAWRGQSGARTVMACLPITPCLRRSEAPALRRQGPSVRCGAGKSRSPFGGRRRGYRLG